MFAAQARGVVLHTCYVMLEGCTLSQMLGMVNTEVRGSGGRGGANMRLPERPTCPANGRR